VPSPNANTSIVSILNLRGASTGGTQCDACLQLLLNDADRIESLFFVVLLHVLAGGGGLAIEEERVDKFSLVAG
jgi:hypothetical protein